MRKPQLAGAQERRKQQNAKAQRTYRAKQKERTKKLEQIAVMAVMSNSPSSGASPKSDTPRGESPYQHSSRQGTASPLCGAQTLQQTGPDLSRYPSASGPASSSWDIAIQDKFAIRDVVRCGLAMAGYAIQPEMFEGSIHLPLRDWLRQVRSVVGDDNIPAVLSSGFIYVGQMGKVSSSSGIPGLVGWHPQATLPNPYADQFMVAPMSVPAALYHNAAHLSIDLEDFCDGNAVSRFFIGAAPPRRQPTPYDNPSYDDLGQSSTTILPRGGLAGGADASEQGIEPDLAPVPAQRAFAHHPRFDVLPWPIFRTKVIMAISMDPPMLDEHDLCMDLLNDGIHCWGSAVSANSGGRGVPWDHRSWEAAPWFLEKWQALTGGREGDMWRNSDWWRALREGG